MLQAPGYVIIFAGLLRRKSKQNFLGFILILLVLVAKRRAHSVFGNRFFSGTKPAQTDAFFLCGSEPAQTDAFFLCGSEPAQTDAFFLCGSEPAQTDAFFLCGSEPAQTKANRKLFS